MGPQRRRNIVVLGSTGSVGTQALEVVRRMPESFRVVALSGHARWQLLAEQVQEFAAEAAVVSDEEGVAFLAGALKGCRVELLCGVEGLCRVASRDGADLVLSAISGAAGLRPAVAALESGKALALANKEAVVMCGARLVKLAAQTGAAILPVDSEHSAIFQLLRSVERCQVERVILTASGGPFYGMSRAELERVTPAQALQHPTWRMGKRITIDSATLMNKALEIVEARWLFGLPPDRIGVLIHPQSVVHCMVELVDGSVLAHMGAPDMRLPIQYALSYPERFPSVGKRLELKQLSKLEFHEPNSQDFPALSVGRRVADNGGTSGAVLTAANEEAVEAFLVGQIRFTDIARLVEMVLDRHEVEADPTFEAAMAACQWAREEAKRCSCLL